jgi:SAM-dependent MidA family methyltransferase
MSLEERLARWIAAGGPVSVSSYMELCLHDPQFGYYATRPRLGAEGDFVTAPHISQMFGELLGLWASEIFTALGGPQAVRLIELGPGDGTMMTDVLRAVGATAPRFFDACEVVLVERSAPLRAAQARALEAGKTVAWIASVEELSPDVPLVILANEFLDCMPICQAVRVGAQWRERCVGIGEDGELCFTGSGGPVHEWSPSAEALAAKLGRLVARAGGAALFLDYGDDGDGVGDTLQALRGHAKEGVLAHPGEADLTAHVRFGPFLAAARGAGAMTAPLVSQGALLRALGIEARAAALCKARPDRAAAIGRQLRRLSAPEEMGDLFKAACLYSPGLAPPGFAAPT